MALTGIALRLVPSRMGILSSERSSWAWTLWVFWNEAMPSVFLTLLEIRLLLDQLERMCATCASHFCSEQICLLFNSTMYVNLPHRRHEIDPSLD